MQFKLFVIDEIELVLRPKNMLGAGLCHITNSGTGKCTRDMKYGKKKC